MKYLFSLYIFLISSSVYAQSSLPPEYIKSFKQLKLNEKYEIIKSFKPAYLQSDFNGDKLIDIAAIVFDKKTKKKGILLIEGGTKKYFVFGAGKTFGNGGDDFKWMGGWELYKKRIAQETLFNEDGDILGSKGIKLLRAAFYIYDLEDGQPNSGGIIYWDGKKYIWIHQGE
jgi:hypothetical protein